MVTSPWFNAEFLIHTVIQCFLLYIFTHNTELYILNHTPRSILAAVGATVSCPSTLKHAAEAKNQIPKHSVEKQPLCIWAMLCPKKYRLYKRVVRRKHMPIRNSIAALITFSELDVKKTTRHLE